MTKPPLTGATGFVLRLYNASGREVGAARLSATALAPFARRIAREEFSRGLDALSDPRFELAPLDPEKEDPRRSPFPAGPTSLTGSRYDAEKEPPPRVTLLSTAPVRFFNFRLLDGATVVFEGNYTADDLFLHAAQSMVRELMDRENIPLDQNPRAYAVEPGSDPAAEFLATARKREEDGSFRIKALDPNRKKIGFKKIQAPPLAEKDPLDFGPEVGAHPACPGTICMRQDVFNALSGELAFSQTRESGGYLVGIPYRRKGSPEKEADDRFAWVVEVTHAVPAREAMADASAFLFTADAWSRISRRMDAEFAGKKLVGWYHTHLFSARHRDMPGLSSWDQDMHRHYMKRKWQVAVLVNLGGPGDREVRCYQRDASNDLVECPYFVIF